MARAGADYARRTQDDWARALHNLKRVGSQLQGPCPLCGGKDRFRVNATGGAFCNQCLPDGSDTARFTELIRTVFGEVPPPHHPQPKRRRTKVKTGEWRYRSTCSPPQTVTVVRKAGKRITNSPSGLTGLRWYPLAGFDPTREVLIVEGETTCDAARWLGLNATTWKGGSGNTAQTDWSAVANGSPTVVIWPDADDPGIECAKKIAAALLERGHDDVRLVDVSDLPDKHDLADIEVDPDIEDPAAFARARVESATPYAPEGQSATDRPKRERGNGKTGGANGRTSNPLQRTQAEWAKALPNLKREGEQLKGPCPLCGGEDRFRVDKTGGAYCNKCLPNGSDTARFLELLRTVFPNSPRRDLDEAAPKSNGETNTEDTPLLPYRRDVAYGPEALEWIAPGWIARRALTLLVGRKGIGKSTIALYVAACVSRGIAPFTEDKAKPGSVLIFSGEDDWRRVLLPRLELMQADRSRIFPITHPLKGLGYTFDWTDEEHRQALWSQVEGDPEGIDLIVVDPLINLIGRGGNNDPAAIRNAIETALVPLYQQGPAIMGLHHERKDARREDLLVDRAIGSQAWSAVARTSLHMQALPSRVAFGHGKTKGRIAKDRKFAINERKLDTNAATVGVVAVAASNIAPEGCGYHYELPVGNAAMVEGEYTYAKVNPRPITGYSAEQLIELYNPLAKESAAERPTDRKARADMRRSSASEQAARAAVVAEFDAAETDKIDTAELIQAVKNRAAVGKTLAKRAIRAETDAKRVGNTYFRVRK